MTPSPHPNSSTRTDPVLELRRKKVLDAIRAGARRSIQIRELTKLNDRQVDSILKHFRKHEIATYTQADGWAVK